MPLSQKKLIDKLFIENIVGYTHTKYGQSVSSPPRLAPVRGPMDARTAFRKL